MPKGRGTSANPANRFHRLHVERCDDGWPGDDVLQRRPETRITHERARSIISHNRSPDVPFEQSVNPYRGCEHGCIYCFARPTHAWLDLSPGLDFETRLFCKSNAADLLREALARPGYRCRPLALGTSTDPYQPLDREHGVTRRILEVLLEARHPVHVITKGAHVLRDLDLLAQLAEQRLATVSISLTSLDPDLKRTLEPRAASASRRLQQMRALTEAGVPVTALVAPVVPILTDPELERLLEAAAGHGACSAGYVLLRLPHEVSPLFRQWLQEHAPGKAARVMGRLREAHGGRDYNPAFGQRMRGKSHWTTLLAQRFRLACRRLGLDHRRLDELDSTRFRPPRDGNRQLPLFPPGG